MGRIRQPTECTALLECPNGCGGVELQGTEYDDTRVFDKFLEVYDHCPSCGAKMNSITQKKPVGMLE